MNLEEISKEDLILYIKSLNEEQNGKYGLVWDREKEPEQIVVECDKMLPILNEITEKNITNEGENNILIEGDNFHALTVLNYTHKEQIDVIYIDPPYNTGNKDFMYNDSFVDEDDGYRHSKWLNFMEKRLKLSRNLLKDDGVIFISIDNNEFAQLKLLCDSIFGEKSFVTTIHVELSATQGMKVKAAKQGNIVKNAEYILVYSKDGHKNIGVQTLNDPVKYDGHYNKYLEFDEQQQCYVETLLTDKIASIPELFDELKVLGYVSKNKISSTKISDIFEKSNLTKQWILDNSSLICRQHDSVDVPEHIKEKYVIGNIYEYISDSRKYYVSKDCENKISQRILLADKIFPCDDFYNTFGPSRIRGDWWSGFYLDMGNVSKEGNIDFPNGKKPVRLLKQLLKFSTKKDAIILDFFAGSGTTGHAVLELNLEDDGNRKFILCTNNESNICIERTYPRIKNVFNNYLDKEIGNLKYFKTDFVENTNNRDQLYYDLTEKCIPMLYLKEDCFELEKSTNEYKIFSNKNKNKFTCIYFDIFGEQEKEFIDYLKGIKEEKIIYKFSLGDYIDNEIFKNIENYSIEPIPYQIVELYRKLVKMSKEGIK